ncbi:unnamed protein product [Cuscuta campestris]|uniref:Reverse transcriptase domain-containing protein n=1 Tax=Cuscuta campestris TaxID=132261 RepID=A0A484MRI0_9ASTE|nr:unnamed protein product [Cuscuta campestris]
MGKRGRPPKTTGKFDGDPPKSPDLQSQIPDKEEPSSSNTFPPDLEEKEDPQIENLEDEEPKSKEKKSYAEVAGIQEDLNFSLKYIPIEEIEGQSIVRLTKEDVIEPGTYWESALVCCILGANPPLEVVKGFVSRIWYTYGIEDVSHLKDGQFIVRFCKEEDRDEVLKRKYYYMDNKPVYVQKWYPGCKVNILERKDIPIWIQLPDLEMKYWSLSGLSKIGSAIGQPIKRDKATVARSKWAYARIQVEVQSKAEEIETSKAKENEDNPDPDPQPLEAEFVEVNKKKAAKRVSLEPDGVDLYVSEFGLYGTEIRLVSEIWNQNHKGQLMNQVFQKLKQLKPGLRQLNRRNFLHLDTEIDEIRTKLHIVQEEMKKYRDRADILHMERELTKELNQKLKASHLMKNQQAKADWITYGDQDSKLFYAWIKKRRIQNHLTSIANLEGAVVEGKMEVARVLVDYYQKQLGESYGFFKGGKGLRQGDPISPLLFVLIMEYLTRSFLFYASKKRFGYHPLCKSLNLISISFADDLIVACKAEEQSINCIMMALKHFKDTTGLSISPTKSEIIFGGVTKQLEEKILQATKMRKGVLPLRYLGGPVTSARISEKDCERLLEKMTRKINSWMTKHVSYAGQAKLINSVFRLGMDYLYTRICFCILVDE